jgi:hypothetical protein
VQPGASTAWLALPMQDTAHFSLTWFTPSAPLPFTVAVRPASGGAVEETVVSPGDPAGIFLPPYPGKGEKARNVLTLLDEAIAALKTAPAPGKAPTLPLCYGGWMAVDQDNEYGRKYARLFSAMGMRNTGVWNGNTKPQKNLAAAGLQPTRSGGCGEYRFPPTPENVASAKEMMTKSGALATMRWFDYGDEIGFGEWFAYMVAQQQKTSGKTNLTVEAMILPLWQQWLGKNRPGFKSEDYWRPAWGGFEAAKLRPDASTEAAAEKPRLYVDSVIFYEDTSIAYVAEGARAVKQALGEQVLSGCNYSCYPYYYPHLPMYSKWFRMGAADYGRHSEYFWQLGQVTPMINGYVAEHFRIGMRFKPKAILRQYTMPHSPGNTDADFQRTAFTHLAHGARNLDFFGIGFNETFTENYIDVRDHKRRIALRDITHALGLVEDLLEESRVVPSEVALLVSDSTERWDHAKIANDHLTKGQPTRNFRDDRLTYHQERVGIYQALTFAGSAPDLVVEEDLLNPDIMKAYKVLFVVGDSLPTAVVGPLEQWVKRGGALLATAGVGRYGMYREPNPALQTLVGIAERKLEERDTFMRTSQEVPFLKPVDSVALVGGQFPALAIYERIKPTPDATTLAVFEGDKSSAVIMRTTGKGKILYAATLPGLAYLYTGLTTPIIWVPDRDPGVHRSVTTYDRVAASLLLQPLAAAGVQPRVKTAPDYIDTRLLAAKNAFILPLANYNANVGQPVTVTIRPPAGAGKPKTAISAYYGKLEVKADDAGWTFTLPKLGYGDIVRIAVK